jgi:PAS domain S-box-containing protein
MESCISGWSMLNGAPAVIADIYADDRILHEVYRATFVKSLIMTPIGEGRPYAAFGAYWDRVRAHTQGDVELLGALGSCAASALERMWLKEQLEGRGETGATPAAGAHDVLETLVRHDAALKQRDAQLADAHRRLNAILDNATVAIFLMDERQQCAYMNTAAEKLTGYSLSETIGRPLRDVVHHTRPDGSPYPREECPIDRAFPERAHMQEEEVFVRKDGSFYPVAFTASPILDEDSRTVGTIIELQDITARVAADAQRELLMREVDHRSRNVLAVVQSLLRLTKAGDPEQLKAVIGDRIAALARAQSSLSNSKWTGASLQQLIRNELQPLTGLGRVRMDCEDLTLAPDLVQPMCMIVHELGTNALKYGGLSTQTGRVDISWRARNGELIELRWRESGGPLAKSPSKRGFGSILLHRLARQLGADLELRWHPGGLEAILIDSKPR